MAGYNLSFRRAPSMSFLQKLLQINWAVVLLICALAGVGAGMLYSAANASMDPWAARHLLRFGVFLLLLIGIALTDIRLWFRVAYPAYFVTLLLLVAVEFKGTVGMGAQRWIDLGVIQLQPSEVMKVTLVLALARYFHSLSLEDVRRPLYLLFPLFLVLAPAGLVLKQPDLGTATMLLLAGGALFLLAGVRWWKFLLVAVGAGAILPIAWNSLHQYQKNRVLTFLDPSSDPLGAGYHITQSKIALGSGGIFGRGFLEGTQSHLNFLPEKQTDFIFTMLAEEFGMVGGMGLIGIYLLIFMYGFAVALTCSNHFGRLLALGLTVNLFFYVFINIAMVMGLLPVVGIPLPLVSYGGTAMLTAMTSFGLILCVRVHKDISIPRRGLQGEVI